MKNKTLKKSIIIATTALITVVSLVEINRKHEYKLLAQSADALEIPIIDDGLWTSKAEITTANTQINNAINDLYVEAIEAGIDIEATIQGATTQAEAIYLVQGALKAIEQQSAEETIEEPEKSEEEVTSEQVTPSSEATAPEEESNVEEQAPVEEAPVQEEPVEEEPVEEEPVVEEKPSETPPANNNIEETPPIDVVAPTIDNFVVRQTDIYDSDSAEVNVSFEINPNENEISKITLVTENETGANKEQNLEINSDNLYDLTGDLIFGNYSFKVVVEYINPTTNEIANVETEVINIDVMGEYIIDLKVTEGENPGEIIIDLTQSILPDSYILYDVYIDGEVREKNIRANDNTIVLKDVTTGAHDYQVVAKYLNNGQIEEITSEIVNFSVTEKPVVTNFIINQSIDSFTNEITVDISFDIQNNGNIINNISATATNVETNEIYDLAEITLIESEEEIISYVNVGTTALPQGTYNFDLVVDYTTNNDETETITASITDYILVAEPEPKTNNLRTQIREKIENF